MDKPDSVILLFSFYTPNHKKPYRQTKHMDEQFAEESAHAKFLHGSSWLLPFEKQMFLCTRNATLLS